MGCCRVTDLRHKEVINSTNGCRVGFVDDVEVNTETARVVSIIIYGRQKFFGFFGRSACVYAWNKRAGGQGSDKRKAPS